MQTMVNSRYACEKLESALNKENEAYRDVLLTSTTTFRGELIQTLQCHL